MYLHNNKKEFEAVVNLSTQNTNMSGFIIEKDYYVTMILRLLSQNFPAVVFKGGTSLSKCHKAIERFSEDIDIAVDTSLSQGKKGKLKDTIVNIAKELGLNICNLKDTRSRRDYNRYDIEYQNIARIEVTTLSPIIHLETSFTVISFPTVNMTVTNYIGEVMGKEYPQMVRDYHLEPFEMKVQTLERTLVDKVFAICDYYLEGKIKNHSRHIYDIFKLLPLVRMNEDFKRLVEDVRAIRKQSIICPSAQDEVNVSSLLRTIIEQNIYQADYCTSTEPLLAENISYDKAIQAIHKIQLKGIFD